MVSLQKAGLQDLEHLQKLYACDLSKYCTEFQCLDSFIGLYTTRLHLKNVEVFTLPDQDLGLYGIVLHSRLTFGKFFVFCNSEQLLEQALHQLDWWGGMQCSSIRSRYGAAVARVVKSKVPPLKFDLENNLYFLPKEEALELDVEVPCGFYLKALSQQDAHVIDSSWEWSHSGSFFFIERQILTSICVGLYQEDNQELVAWCIRAQDGFLAALQVKDSHQRRGFGAVVVKEYSRRVALLDYDVIAEVYPGNKASSGLFRKLGFKVIDQCRWLATVPSQGDFTWPDGE
ncbi:GL18696 [Drosophila persimilis]|uniref:GL18696 n=1 Tax=Drosophila persimilis TaxID=7234 RepID=B4G992_DROPE|nr:GL18696 [Drosophila persimilis]